LAFVLAFAFFFFTAMFDPSLSEVIGEATIVFVSSPHVKPLNKQLRR